MLFVAMGLMLIPRCTQGASILCMFFYDSPTLPTGIFDDFLAIPQSRSDLGTRGMASMATTGNYSGQILGHRWVTEGPSAGPWSAGQAEAKS